jgi:putative membrane protein
MKSLSKVVFAIALACALFAMPSVAQQDAPPTKTSPSLVKTDASFMKQAADGGMAEIALGNLAVSKASSDDVKKFGQRMVDDHSKANDQLKQLAEQKHVTLPDKPSKSHQATEAKLSGLSGDSFDRAYMAEMLKDHKKDVADFKKASRSAADPEVKNFAASTLPTLQDHLKQAQSITSAQGSTTTSQAAPNASQR